MARRKVLQRTKNEEEPSSKQEAWIKRILDLNTFPGPQTEFCKKHRLRPKQLSHWKRKLVQEGFLEVKPRRLEEMNMAGLRKEIKRSGKTTLSGQLEVLWGLLSPIDPFPFGNRWQCGESRSVLPPLYGGSGRSKARTTAHLFELG